MKALAPRALHRRIRIPHPLGERDEDGKVRMIEVENDQLIAHGTLFLKAVEQHSRLHGVVAPQQLQLLSPDALEIERTVTKLVEIATRDEAKEADILVEEVDGIFMQIDPPSTEQEAPDGGTLE